MNSTTTHYLYDASDQRVQQDIKIGALATATTKYWSGYEVTGATTTLYIYAGGALVATIEGNGSATSTNVIHTDHLGGTNVVSDGSGALKQLVNYYPYGSSRINQQTTTNFNEKRKYIGQYSDDATTLNYLNARYEAATAGKFLAEDPILLGVPDTKILLNPQALNYYSYANNNPINASDPSGLRAFTQAELAYQQETLIQVNQLYAMGKGTVGLQMYNNLQSLIREITGIPTGGGGNFVGGGGGSSAPAAAPAPAPVVQQAAPSGGFFAVGGATMAMGAGGITLGAYLRNPVIIIAVIGAVLYEDYLLSKKGQQPSQQARPEGLPSGSKPIDDIKLPKGQVERIKDAIGSGSRDSTWVAPNGDIYTNEGGNAEPAGNTEQYGKSDGRGQGYKH